MTKPLFTEEKFAVKLDRISKSYNDIKVVDQFSVDIENGQIFGLLGPNAAGKTTIMRILCGLIDPDDGQITIQGLNTEDAKAQFGYVAQHFAQYEELTVWENIQFYAQIYGVTDEPHLHELLSRYQLVNFKDKRAGNLSGGYQRKLALVCALTHDPQVIFLDEPTAGIDPVSRKRLWDDFYDLSQKGKCLFITTHYMEEAQRCHQLAFIAKGKTIATGSPTTIKKSLGRVQVLTANIDYHPQLQDVLSAHPGMLLVHQFGSQIRMIMKPEILVSELKELFTKYLSERIVLQDGELNLEDVFIALTQQLDT